MHNAENQERAYVNVSRAQRAQVFVASPGGCGGGGGLISAVNELQGIAESVARAQALNRKPACVLPLPIPSNMAYSEDQLKAYADAEAKYRVDEDRKHREQDGWIQRDEAKHWLLFALQEAMIRQHVPSDAARALIKEVSGLMDAP